MQVFLASQLQCECCTIAHSVASVLKTSSNQFSVGTVLRDYQLWLKSACLMLTFFHIYLHKMQQKQQKKEEKRPQTRI